MTKKLLHEFAIGPTDYGKWLAISAKAPYFAFEGDSAEEVEAIACRAVDFYFGESGRIRNSPVIRERPKTLSSFSPQRRVERECA